jgi:hypothetical protein
MKHLKEKENKQIDIENFSDFFFMQIGFGNLEVKKKMMKEDK